MSRAFLEELLDEMVESLASVRQEHNLVEHDFTISQADIYNAVFTELNFKQNGKDIYPGWATLPEDEKLRQLDIIEQSLENIMSKIHANILKARAEIKNTESKAYMKVWPSSYTEGTKEIRILTLYPEGSGIVRKFWWLGENATEVELTSFDATREIYRNEVNRIFSNLTSRLKTYYKKAYEGRTDLTENQKNWVEGKGILVRESGDARKIALGHSRRELVEIAASRADTKFRKLLQTKKLSSGARQRLLREFGFEVFLEYESTINATVMKVGIESFSDNSEAGLKLEKAFLKERREALKRLDMSLRGAKGAKKLEELEGSDSRPEIEKKKIVKIFNDKLTSKKVTSIDTKVNTSKHRLKKKVAGKISKKTRKGNVKPGASKKYPQAKAPNQSSSISLQSLIPVINSKLSASVRKNMQFPALINRTGRFADSVQVTDITETPQGFPSIGYNYMKYPYQTFEVGYERGTADRDPRKLIDKSIREVAAELVVGRFYTRRV